MKLHTRWQETRYGVFQRRTEHELFCRIALSEQERAVYESLDIGSRLVCAYVSRGLRLDTRLSSLIAGETRFGSEDRSYLEEIERQVLAAADDLAEALGTEIENGGEVGG